MKIVCARCGQPLETRRGWIAPLLGVVLDLGAALASFFYGEWVWGLGFLALFAWSAHALLKAIPFAQQRALCAECSPKDKLHAQ